VEGGAASIAEAGAVERLLDDVVCSPEALAAAVDAAAERVAGAAIALLGDGVERHAARLREHLGVDALFLPLADYPLRGAAVAALGARALIESGADDPASLAPRYARVSDAERMRAVRLAAGGGVGLRR
jgi:hypothetical protein